MANPLKGPCRALVPHGDTVQRNRKDFITSACTAPVIVRVACGPLDRGAGELGISNPDRRALRETFLQVLPASTPLLAGFQVSTAPLRVLGA